MSIKYSEHYCQKKQETVTMEETYSKSNSTNTPDYLYCMNSADCLTTDCEFAGKDQHYIN